MAEVVSGRPLADAQQVEAAIRDLWRREAGAGGPVTRLRTLNLVVMAGDEAADPLVQAVLDGIPHRHPSRVIVLRIAAETPAGTIDSSVRVNAASGEASDRQLLSEEVTLTAAPDAAGQLAGVVLPLLVPDLPTFLWWAPPGSAFEHPLFAELSQVCDLTLVDTAGSEAGGIGALRALAEQLTLPHQPRLLDVNWSRIYAWRELTAQFFDGAGLRDLLDAISTVEVTYEGAPGRSPGSTQSVLFVAWLASRLGWRLTAARGRSGDREFWFERPDGDVSVHIGRREVEGASGIAEVVLVSGEDEGSTQFVVRRLEDRALFETLVLTPGAGERRRVTRFDEPDDAEVVFDELDFRGGDQAFEDALAIVRQLPERGER